MYSKRTFSNQSKQTIFATQNKQSTVESSVQSNSITLMPLMELGQSLWHLTNRCQVQLQKFQNLVSIFFSVKNKSEFLIFDVHKQKNLDFFGKVVVQILSFGVTKIFQVSMAFQIQIQETLIILSLCFCDPKINIK